MALLYTTLYTGTLTYYSVAACNRDILVYDLVVQHIYAYYFNATLLPIADIVAVDSKNWAV